MSPLVVHSVLHFRVYREAALRLYADIVDELCRSPHLPFQLATTLEDIGQAFMKMAAQVNAELAHRGLLDQEVDADGTVEAQIEALLDQLPMDGRAGRFYSGAQAQSPAGDGSVLKSEAVRQALRLALTMTHDLPVAGNAPRGR